MTAADAWQDAGEHATRRCFTVMGGPAEIHLVGATAARRLAAIDAAVDELRRIEARYSRFRPDSWVSRVNARAGRTDPVEVDAETASLLDFADHLHRASDGRFDITSGALARAWDFRQARLPAAPDIEAARARVGWTRVRWDGRRLALPEPGMAIDFGGIGKEYAADRAAAVVLGRGVAHGFVDLAGDLRVLGPALDGRAWRLGIRDPRDPGATIATVALARGALATSGDYERGFDLGGRRFHHLLDATTGWPARGWRSVSVTAPVCVAAGALATLAMLAGDRAPALLRAEPVGWLAVDDAGRLHHGTAADAPAAVTPAGPGGA